MSKLKYFAVSPDGKIYRSTSISGIKKLMRRNKCRFSCPIKLVADNSYIGQTYNPQPHLWKR